MRKDANGGAPKPYFDKLKHILADTICGDENVGSFQTPLCAHDDGAVHKIARSEHNTGSPRNRAR